MKGAGKKVPPPRDENNIPYVAELVLCKATYSVAVTEAPVLSKGDSAYENTVMPYVVGGAFAFILRISSFFGLAPLRFKSRSNGFTVSISYAMCIYSYIFVTILVILTIFGLAAEVNMSARVSSKISKAVLASDMLLVAVIAVAGVYGAPKRMHNMLKFMESIASVDHSIGARYSHKTERKLCGILLTVLILFSIFIVDDFCFYALQAEKHRREWNVAMNYIGVYILWCVAMILELQFAFTALSVRARFQAVNNALALSATLVSAPVGRIPDPPPLNALAIHVVTNERRRCVNVNLLVDTLYEQEHGVMIRNTATGEIRLVLPPCEAIHKLACLHGALCDIVQVLDRSYGLPLILILMSTLLHMIETTYFFILEIVVSTSRVHFLVLQFLWIAMHMLRMFLVAEPCHYTIAEAKRTEELVSRVMRSAPSKGSLQSRLEMFSRQLLLQSTTYSPMGICTLDRSLVVSLLGVVTTYLVILIQFQTDDTDNNVNNFNNTV